MPLYFQTSTGSYHSFGDSVFEITDDHEPVAIQRGFDSKKQQKTAVAFITEALERYNDEWIRACRGEEQEAKVCIRPELEAQLANGELLRR